MQTTTGLERLLCDRFLQQKCKGNIAYLCHNTSVDRHCREGFSLLPIDLINGMDRLRHWVEPQGDRGVLQALETEGADAYLGVRKPLLLHG